MCAKSLQWCWTLWTSCTAGFSIHGFTRQEYWCELLCPSPGDLPNAGIEPVPPMSPALAGVFFTTSTTEKPIIGLPTIVQIFFSQVSSLY